MAIGTDVSTAETPPATATTPVRARKARRLRLPRSRKVLVGAGLLVLFVLLAVVGPLVAPYDPAASLSTTNGVPQPPSAAHWLGTTQIQQDVLSQMLVGGRSTMLVAVVAALIATALSVIIGVSSGYVSGLADDLLSMVINIGLVLPALPLLIVMTGFLPKSANPSDLLIGLIIAATGWAWGARVLRVQTLSLRNRDFVKSARIIGERRWRIIGFEILPGLVPVIASSFLFTVIYGVGTYTALAFLGLINGTHWSWGTILFWAQSQTAAQNGYWWWWVPPGLAVALFGTSLALLNFGIDEFINPRLRAGGLSRRRARKAGLPQRFPLGVTPVTRPAAPTPAPAAAGRLAAEETSS